MARSTPKRRSSWTWCRRSCATTPPPRSSKAAEGSPVLLDNPNVPAISCTTVIKLPGQVAQIVHFMARIMAEAPDLPQGVINLFFESGPALNFSNPELKKIMPWTGTDKGPRAYSGTFLGVANYWKIEDFTVTDKFASGEDVAVFGKFTYRSVALGHVITSPFSINAKVLDGKIVYFQFMEDTYATASSFRQTGSWVVKATVASTPIEVGAE